LLWVIERRSNLSLSEFIEKYDGKRFVVWFWCWKRCYNMQWCKNYWKKVLVLNE
jgi:hypothetical protein